MVVSWVLEHNGPDSLLYCATFPGAYTRGATPEEALKKTADELLSYFRWAGITPPDQFEVQVAENVDSDLNIRDADSDVIFDFERQPLTMEEYQRLKALVLKSASDFQALYDAVPDKKRSNLTRRRTFYGDVPRTAEEMYRHTKNVNEYYFWEIGVDADNEGTIAECRQRGFEKLEQISGFLERPAVTGSYGEEWSLRKLLRRFLWHDRIHAKAMYRMAVNTFGKNSIPDIFRFET